MFCKDFWKYFHRKYTQAAVVESHVAINSVRLIDLSAQNLLDCTKWSCNGGYVVDAFKYIQKNGIESEKNYPYEMRVRTLLNTDKMKKILIDKV